MPSTPLQSTPMRSSAAAKTPVTESPGTWRHPRLDEITRRRNATTFNEKNMARIAYNIAGLLMIWLGDFLVHTYLPSDILPTAWKDYLTGAYLLLQIVPLLNIAVALIPLFRRVDDLSDIPLTSEQRQLLGLPAVATASSATTNNAGYSTPPRYSRTPSFSGSVGSRGSFNGSPLSGRGSPVFNGANSGSAYSPVSSPLMHKMSAFRPNETSRQPLASQSPRAVNGLNSSFADSSSSSPNAGKRTSVGLNSKWLYERGRRSTGNALSS